MAATVLAEQAVAPLFVALVLPGHQATVATTATVAAMAGNGTAVTADEGEGNQREEHSERKTEKTLHKKPPHGETERSRCVHEAVRKGTPIRDGHRTAATDVSLGRGQQRP